jgi:hypothetical protein
MDKKPLGTGAGKWAGKESGKSASILVLAVMMLLLALPSAVYSLGVSPGRTTVDFSPGLQKTVVVNVLNNEKKDMQLAIFARGELANYVSLSQDSMSFLPSEGQKQFTYNVSLPSTLDPGLKEAEIVVREVTGGSSEGETTVRALVAVVSQLHVNVPYPGKYLTADLFVEEAKQGEPVKFYIPVKSYGEDRIDSAAPTIIIYSQNGTEMARIAGEAVSIDSQQSHEFGLEWDANVQPGIYRAAASVDYDGNRVAAEKQFLVGEFFLKPLDISVNNFRLGQVAKLNILVENIGNTVISDASANINLKDDAGRQAADITTQPAEVPVGSSTELYGYWDTADVQQGTYTGSLKVGYGDKFAEKQIKMLVQEDAISTEIVGVTGQVIGSAGGGGLAIKPVYLILAFLIIANIVWMVYYRKKRQGAQ